MGCKTRAGLCDADRQGRVCVLRGAGGRAAVAKEKERTVRKADDEALVPSYATSYATSDADATQSPGLRRAVLVLGRGDAERVCTRSAAAVPL
eukprot:2992163-Rhodomonas_salina.1